MLRLDQLMAGAARERLWLTDAYFGGTPEYVQALRAAAADDVDVRILVPGASDIPMLQPISRAGYRPLLEAGVRVYEWRGSMLHAKTAVVDDHWARVGSSNLNVASWIGNWELDVAVDDRTFGAAMAAMYLVDLGYSTEIVLSESRIVDRTRTTRPRPALRGGVGSAGRLAAGALRLGNTVTAMITERRVLGLADARAAALTGFGFLLFAVIAFLWPTVVAIPLGLLIVWLGVAMVAKAHSLRKQREEAGKAPLRVVEAGSD
jgi:cardiolipin synthase